MLIALQPITLGAALQIWAVKISIKEVTMNQRELSAMRREYARETLDEQHTKENPLEQFRLWFDEAAKACVMEPNAMTLATVTPAGRAAARVVLLKDFDEDGFVFYTNYKSAKGRELAQSPGVTLLFFWPELERQVRISGLTEKVSEAESEEYFHSRPLEAKWGAWASKQSEKIADRAQLEEWYNEVKQKFAEQVPRPPHWGGYRVRPDYFEFWQGRPGRMHDRIVYEQQGGDGWIRYRLSP